MRVPALAAAMVLALGADVPTQGRTTVTFFIASDCPISNAYAPEIARICTSYQSKGVACTLAYEDAALDASGVRTHLAEYRLQGIRATIDKDRKLADGADVTITPTAVVTDGRNQMRYHGRIDNLYINIGRTRQQVTSHDLTDALDAVLAGAPVKQARTDTLGCYIERLGK